MAISGTCRPSWRRPATWWCCGDAGEALGDSLYEARLFVRGKVKSLGADCVEKEMRPEHLDLLADLLERADDAKPEEFRRYGSARKLYNFNIDNAIVLRRHDEQRHPRTPPIQSATFSNDRQRRDPARRGDRHLRHPRRRRQAPVPHFDDLLFLGASISRYPLEGYRETCGTDVTLGTRMRRPRSTWTSRSPSPA
jgi:hypothetical protein